MFKIKQLIKKFLFALSEEGIGIALWRTQRKIIKKIVKTVTGKEIFQADIEVLKIAQLESPKPIEIETSDDPLVSIIIPVYNQFLYTFNCLNSISKTLDKSFSFEVIVVDDCSTDETEKGLEQITGIRRLKNSNNMGFIRSCNAGSSAAKGKFLYFLNNDTQILSGCLESLLDLIQNNPKVGAVGSKLIYPDGRLQEAGGIIWQDASGWNYGRLQNPDEPEYNYVREVDYCSGASLLVRADIFRQLGGFSETFLPAYYEDTDLCFALRKLGYKVLYQPQSKLIHYEGITSGTDLNSGAKQYQQVNYTKFQQKWKEELSKHFSNDPNHVPKGARRLQGKPTILVIDSYVPLYDRESGCVRLLGILKILQNLGYSIIFLPDNGFPEEPYTSTLQGMGIEVLYSTPTQPNLEEQLINRLSLVDTVWLCRPELCEKYLDLIRHYAKVPVIYDTIDLHFLRIKRQQDYLSGDYQNTTWSWETYQKQETKFAQATEATVVVTEVEKKTLNDLDINKVWVIPNIHHPYEGQLKSFEQRSDLVFIGSYNHPPNIDAVIWLCQEIMPIIWQSNPEIKVILLGSNMKDEVKALESERVIVQGYVEEVEPYFLTSRLFVAPLRFGAGMKGKIGHSMSYGLPTVTTKIGAEGMGLTDGYDVLIADEPQAFAQKVLQLYNNAELWHHLSENSLKTISQYSPEKVQEKLAELLFHLRK
ncbi:glycosyltransferase [Gloeothece verrucosa]|uniref:Glycosyl transferase family 2 n=1 Tax=Gloeothece verrucosa (strain PCC 7822) TaxID=497965 RepID=E0UDF0_GLOV7|nr:glycosyltransferase [Gloeothece verrucosa]ADN14141.1 glycosyl transferase family 2 [Gloeothece verrucosa PCC 7822]